MTTESESPTPSSGEMSPARRAFLAWLSVVLGGLAAAIVAVPVVGFLIGPLLKKTPEVWRVVGFDTDFRIGATVRVKFLDPSPAQWAGVTALTAAWLRRESEDRFIAFAINCTHLGCPVRWLRDADLFMCPCHGGVYYNDGRVAAGPPPRPLFTYPVRVMRHRVEIRTSPVPIG